MGEQTMLKGDRAVAHSVLSAQPDVVSAYPITPQTGIVEKLSEMDANGDLRGQFLKVDSEFNAASSCIGASGAGARVFSATSSQGLKLMSEPLFTASGMRLPLVLAVANRSLSGPLSIWNDHTDAFAERDGGMIQFFAEDVQEAVDNILMAYRVAEDPEISLPALANLDGYILTHVKEPVEVPTEEETAEYLPKRDPHATLDPKDPKTMGAFARPEHWTETRFAVHDALLRSKETIGDAVEEFADQFGRDYGLEWGGLLETYGPEDAEIALLGLGSIVGTMRDVADDHPASVKVVKPRVIRPYPEEALREALAGVESVGVLTKEVSPGHQGTLAAELKSALYGSGHNPAIHSSVLGLAGRDVTKGDISDIIDEIVDATTAGPSTGVISEEDWPQLKRDMLPDEVTH
ncbi:pyruvate ferredoxin oxidoreductase [Halanaeroarchaeum sulfurireducens]|uniref:Pyruvate:ferredoxin oxidoreductase, alpha subunit n=1 Tax=Halanaeroarchaeum sulfurireducens TaxID=1604004 RepID=A0A0F7PCB9_9EURY|nr:pyruvate ferredoxin oxidoreductase [Halanaeroarchaeum sulfurireducens]AKH96993.1 pyruvate:ferredoxin oxidoreductase, alpha subunit [Halanaeroarchaeum sulfurireducens]ALG81394.1 pyruvate:ferredoxin oxidoreductase, alpha subunit [Halanaeroarchaeum sulfurireducens]